MSLIDRILAGRRTDPGISAAVIHAVEGVSDPNASESLTQVEDQGQNTVDSVDDADSADTVAEDSVENPTSTAADPAEIAEYCAANACAGMAAGLIRERVDMDTVRQRVGAAGTIRQMVSDAGRVSESITSQVADEYIGAGLSVDQARAKLFDTIVARQSAEIVGAISSDTALSSADTGWAKSREKFKARKFAN